MAHSAPGDAGLRGDAAPERPSDQYLPAPERRHRRHPVQVRGGKLLVTGGPFAETTEQIGGFFLIEADNFQEALQIAARWPSARLGTIEVRPIEDGLRMESRYGGTQ